jgi:3-phenylpropionate/trans-cinnamate dioxygenase ferredoxin component
MAFTKVATAQEILPGTGKEVTLGGKTLAVFNDSGTFYALDNTCTHSGAPLAEGDCLGGEVVCPWHGARFNLKTGEVLSRPAPRGVAAYRVQVVGDEVQVDV